MFVLFCLSTNDHSDSMTVEDTFWMSFLDKLMSDRALPAPAHSLTRVKRGGHGTTSPPYRTWHYGVFMYVCMWMCMCGCEWVCVMGECVRARRFPIMFTFFFQNWVYPTSSISLLTHVDQKDSRRKYPSQVVGKLTFIAPTKRISIQTVFLPPGWEQLVKSSVSRQARVVTKLDFLMLSLIYIFFPKKNPITDPQNFTHDNELNHLETWKSLDYGLNLGLNGPNYGHKYISWRLKLPVTARNYCPKSTH